jgi:hypothetical protein
LAFEVFLVKIQKWHVERLCERTPGSGLSGSAGANEMN